MARAAVVACASMWIVTLLAVASFAQDERCPDPMAAVRSAEQDAVSFFLRDSELALTEAIAGMACGPRATPELLAPFWLARGAIWSFLDDGRADSAFAAARSADSDHFFSDYGEGIEARWKQASAPAGDGGNLILRGLEDGDWVSVDGLDVSDPWPIPSGLHLIQVGSGDKARFARLLDMASGAEVTVVVPASGEAVAAPTMKVAGVVPFIAITGPILRQKGGYVDASGEPLSWRLQVQPIAAADPAGRNALQLHRANLVTQIGIGAVGGAALYSGYLWTWDATTGHNIDTGAAWVFAGVSGAAAGGASALIVRLIRRRKGHRDDIEAAANRTLGGAPR